MYDDETQNDTTTTQKEEMQFRTSVQTIHT